MNKSIYIGKTFLDNSKFLTYDVFYNELKKTIRPKVRTVVHRHGQPCAWDQNGWRLQRHRIKQISVWHRWPLLYIAPAAALQRFWLAETCQRWSTSEKTQKWFQWFFSPNMRRTFFATSRPPCLSGVSPARVTTVRRSPLLLYLLIPAPPPTRESKECLLSFKWQHQGKLLLAADSLLRFEMYSSLVSSPV